MRTFLTILLLLMPVCVFAADGAKISSADVTKGSFDSQSFVLCDGVLEADSSCDEFDLNQSGAGMPDWFIFSRDAVDSDCTGDVTIAINGQTTTGGTEHVITTLNDAYTSMRVEGPRHRFIDADLSNQGGCDDGAADTGVTVNMTLFFKKR
jgi:hypothetical protein